jgi:hypothetical protein
MDPDTGLVREYLPKTTWSWTGEPLFWGHSHSHDTDDSIFGLIIRDIKEEAPGPTEEAPTEEASTEAAPTEEAPTQAASTEAAPTEEAPTEAAPKEDPQ